MIAMTDICSSALLSLRARGKSISQGRQKNFVAGSGMMKSEDKKELGERLVKLAQSELETLKK